MNLNNPSMKNSNFERRSKYRLYNEMQLELAFMHIIRFDKIKSKYLEFCYLV